MRAIIASPGEENSILTNEINILETTIKPVIEFEKSDLGEGNPENSKTLKIPDSRG